MTRPSQSLEQIVANRYAYELSQNGFNPVCEEAEEMLEDALKVMAALNQASHFIKQSVLQRRAAT